MVIEWWMIDGAVCLIIILAALTGAVRGIGDTVLRILGIAGGLFLGTMYSDRVEAFLMQTKIKTTLYDHISVLLRSSFTEETGAEGLTDSGASAAESESSAINSLFSTGPTDDSSNTIISKSLGAVFDSAADQAIDDVATRLTEIAIGIIAFALIIIAVSLIVTLLRTLLRKVRKTSLVLGFADRVLGFVLGGVRGLLLAWVAVAVLIPVTTIVAPDSVTGMISALQATTVARVIYDVNPFLLIFRSFM